MGLPGLAGADYVGITVPDLDAATRFFCPRNSDVGGHHLGFYVTDLNAAVAHLRKHGVKVFGDPTLMTEGPSAGLHWVYFTAPWGMTMELVSYAKGMAYESTKKALWRPAAD